MMKLEERVPLNTGEDSLRVLTGDDIDIGNGAFVLTNQRVAEIRQSSSGHESSFRSFNLEELDSMELNYSSPFWAVVLLVCLGVGCIIAAAALEQRDRTPALVLAVFGILWLLSALLVGLTGRKRTLLLQSRRIDIALSTRPNRIEELDMLATRIQAAKQARLQSSLDRTAASGHG